jgi:hypothetical protein
MSMKVTPMTNDTGAMNHDLGLELGGAEQFRRLSASDRANYIDHARKMTTFARDHAVPVIFAPPLSKGGKVNGATAFVLKIGFESFVVTASHVLEAYEMRILKGETLNWQIGKLPPFDPLMRVAWRDKEKDIVVLRISVEDEENIGRCIRSTPLRWPPPVPREGQMVLVAGFPGGLREVDPSGWIGAGPYSALFRVTRTGSGYCKCRLEQKDLVSFCEAPVPSPGTKIGGVSGGPVFLVGSGYPLVGVITEHCYMNLANLEILQFATLENVSL